MKALDHGLAGAAPARPAQPLSDVHAMLAIIERRFDAVRLNEIVNHPEVHPWVRGFKDEPLDLSSVVANPAHILLVGPLGAVVCIQHQPGFYECHTQVLPEGRGQWAATFAEACLLWMFTRTEAMEITTRVPHGNLPARVLARKSGFKRLFTNPRGWIREKEFVPADIFSITIQDWLVRAPGLDERGHWFHERLEEEYRRHGREEPPHPDDAVHDRYVGAAVEMIIGGQWGKATILYNRWAVMADYAPLTVTSVDPLTFDIVDTLIIARPDGTFWVPLLKNKDGTAASVDETRPSEASLH